MCDIWPWSLWGGVYDVNSNDEWEGDRMNEWVNELYWVTFRHLCVSYNGPLILSLFLSVSPPPLSLSLCLNLSLSFFLSHRKKGRGVSLGKWCFYNVYLAWHWGHTNHRHNISITKMIKCSSYISLLLADAGVPAVEMGLNLTLDHKCTQKCRSFIVTLRSFIKNC